MTFNQAESIKQNTESHITRVNQRHNIAHSRAPFAYSLLLPSIQRQNSITITISALNIDST
ncbi:unnamed protein product [Periconia digitata]|uniref:Uncharacterized protein n=1 Tax=Periconia digitata TaxID=1303443 RepID=A0A9W4XPP9_9PLEO|nr:unnamed protein product [Periconia digitata]